ncbi:hypothetical protein GKE82_21540 [Conexibacter sp. W3-3-2]|uniref:hypothetical protein n=1 Tax=Conexibacter sp. W3-3-2 TaxID=2675227 RepID=UPI0012B83A86|nr:hypothetical protein [Conexibacter sp. W3-3-2]MTD46803.1 hypothetical protein [Conexibacter sp. W3-3-2]
MTRRGLVAALALGAVLAGCAGGTPSPDLFVVERSGTNPGAQLRLRVTDGGFVSCNGGPERAISSDQLIDARDIVRDLNDDDREDTPGLLRTRPSLPPRPGSQLRYVVRAEDGSARFADNAADAPEAYLKLAALVRALAKGPCGLPR